MNTTIGKRQKHILLLSSADLIFVHSQRFIHDKFGYQLLQRHS